MVDRTTSGIGVATSAWLRTIHDVPTANVPQFTFPLRIAHMAEDQMDAIEAALIEASEKKPSYSKLAVSLASPIALMCKGVEDMVRAVAKSLKEAVEKLDWWSLGTAALVILIGFGAVIALVVQFKNDRKPSRLNTNAIKYIKEWRARLPPS